MTENTSSAAVPMGIWANFINCFKKYAEFGGRSPRMEYWSFILVLYVLTMAVGFVIGYFKISVIVSNIYQILIVIPFLSAGVRRFHDAGQSAAMYFSLWGVIIFSAFLLNMVHPYFVLLTIVGIALMLYFLLRRSEAKENEYGPVPVVKSPRKEIVVTIVGFCIMIVLPISLTMISVNLQQKNDERYQEALMRTLYQVNAVSQEIMASYGQSSDYAGLDAATALKNKLLLPEISSECKPESFVDGQSECLRTSLGSGMVISSLPSADNRSFMISLTRLDEGTCLLMKSAADKSDMTFLASSRPITAADFGDEKFVSECKCTDSSCSVAWKF